MVATPFRFPGLNGIRRQRFDARIEQISAPPYGFDDALRLAERATDLHQALHQ